MWDATRTSCIIYNGEVYNYRELRRTLERDRFEFRNNTDTEVILNLYLRDGAAMLRRSKEYSRSPCGTRARVRFCSHETGSA
jgi:Asparagine synthase (glutamine-hydrolyzing)